MKQSEHSKQFILALQPHEAFPSHRKSAWSPAYLCLGLILLMGLAFSAPTAVNITSPTDADGELRTTLPVNISYNESTSEGQNITHYNITLLNSDSSFNQEIIGNNSLELSYLWTPGNLATGDYIINVRAYDNNSEYTDSESDVISFWNPIISDCANLTQANKYYELNQSADLPTSGDAENCIVFKASNITLNCAGNSVITHNSMHKAIYSEQDKSTIENCALIDDAVSSPVGLVLYYATNAKLINITSGGSTYAYITASYSDNLTIVNSTLDGASANMDVVDISSSSNVNISDSSFHSASFYHALSLDYCDYSTLKNLNLDKSSGQTGGKGLGIYNSNYMTVSNISMTSSYGQTNDGIVYIHSSNHGKYSNLQITQSDTSAGNLLRVDGTNISIDGVALAFNDNADVMFYADLYQSSVNNVSISGVQAGGGILSYGTDISFSNITGSFQGKEGGSPPVDGTALIMTASNVNITNVDFDITTFGTGISSGNGIYLGTDGYRLNNITLDVGNDGIVTPYSNNIVSNFAISSSGIEGRVLDIAGSNNVFENGSLTGTGSSSGPNGMYGVYLTTGTNNTLRNIATSVGASMNGEFNMGIYIGSTSDIHLSNVSSDHFIKFESVSNIVYDNSTTTSPILLSYASSSKFENLVFTDTSSYPGNAILYYSDNNNFTNVSMTANNGVPLGIATSTGNIIKDSYFSTDKSGPGMFDYGSAIDLNGTSNVTIENTAISAYGNGINIYNFYETTGLQLVNSNVTSTYLNGISGSSTGPSGQCNVYGSIISGYVYGVIVDPLPFWIENTTISSSTGAGLELTSATGSTFKNITATGSTYGIEFNASASSSGNTFYWNNFTSTTFELTGDGGNTWEANVSGNNEGNIWADVIDGTKTITGSTYSTYSTGYPELFIGTGGADYPYVQGTITDNAPLTNQQGASTPEMQTVTITPETATIYDALIGYCNATDADEDSLIYHYKWYLNDVENETGTSSSEVQGIELNVANITSGLELGQNWTLECTPDDGTTNGTAMNSSVKTISALNCRTLNQENMEYPLTENISISGSTCLIVEASNITIDCAGYSIIGDGTSSTSGIYSDQTDTNIINCVIENFDIGVDYSGAINSNISNSNISALDASVRLEESSSSIMLSNLILSSTNDAIDINMASNISVLDSIMTAGRYGIGAYECENSTFLKNNITSTSSYSIVMATSTANTVVENTIIGDGWIYDNTLDGNYYNNSTTGNIYYKADMTPSWTLYDITVSSAPGWATGGSDRPFNSSNIAEFGDSSSYAVDWFPWTENGQGCIGETSTFVCGDSLTESCTMNTDLSIDNSNCFNITAQNITVDCNGFSMTGNNASNTNGIFSDKFNTTIKNCIISNFQYGIEFSNADNGTIENCTLSTTEANGRGLNLELGSDYNVINNVKAVSISKSGLVFSSSRYNTVSNSVAQSKSERGFYLSQSYHNNIINSNFTSNTSSALYFDNSRYNNVTNCTAHNLVSGTSGTGIRLMSSSNGNIITGTSASSMQGHGIYIQQGVDIVVDCQGAQITGKNYTGQYGIRIDAINATVRNCVIKNFSAAISLSAATGAIVKNNTLFADDGRTRPLLIISDVSESNTFCWNNFTDTAGMYVNSSNGKNAYNSSICNGEGNIYHNVINGSVQVTGTTNSSGFPSLFIGSGGTGLPYGNTTSNGKFFCESGCADYAPLTLEGSSGSSPVIEWITEIPAQDPISCEILTLPVVQMNISDADGWEDINLSNTNIQIYNDEFSIQHDSVECVVDSNDTNWVVVNCTGIEFNFYDDAGEYIVEGNTEDISESSEQEFGTNLTYNAGTHVQINNTPVTFGTLGAGTIDNLNTNSPAFNIQNCGNVNLNMTVTGSNITDGDSNSISASQFRVNDGIMTNLILSEEALDYSTSGGQSIGASSLREFSFLANIPVAQPQTIYNTGTWTFIVSPS